MGDRVDSEPEVSPGGAWCRITLAIVFGFFSPGFISLLEQICCEYLESIEVRVVLVSQVGREHWPLEFVLLLLLLLLLDVEESGSPPWILLDGAG